MTARKPNEWLTPPMIIAYVSMLAAFGSFWLSFDHRVTANEINIAATASALRDHRTDEAADVKDIKDNVAKLTTLMIERKGGKS